MSDRAWIVVYGAVAGIVGSLVSVATMEQTIARQQQEILRQQEQIEMLGSILRNRDTHKK